MYVCVCTGVNNLSGEREACQADTIGETRKERERESGVESVSVCVRVARCGGG